MTILERIKFEEDWLSEVNLTKENIKIAFAGLRATALESQRYKPIILQEHDAEPRTMKAIIDTATDEIYVCKLTKQGAKILGMTIEEVNADEQS